jgi:hypothetical protein
MVWQDNGYFCCDVCGARYNHYSGATACEDRDKKQNDDRKKLEEEEWGE